MVGPARSLARITCVAAVVAGLAVTGRARAEVEVSIQVDSEERLELARRLSSELESEGYRVQLSADAGASPCEEGGVRPVAVLRDAKAWIRLNAGPDGDSTVVASICYLGALPFLQQAASSAPSSDPQTLAVATAEALNGLRSRLPPVVGEPPRPTPVDDSRKRPRAATAERHVADDVVNQVAVGAAILFELPDYPGAPGVVLRTTLGMAAWAGLTFDAFVPTRGAELESAQVTAAVRTAWLRLGPRIGGELADFHLSGALLAGPALTWAEAVARAPRIGTADVSPGAILSLAGFVEYPRRTPLFACAAASASVLVPGSRVSLGASVPAPRGSFPVEASLGVGLRWGD
jgi:hypothetical protein